MIPKFRAEKIDGKEVVEGLISIDKKGIYRMGVIEDWESYLINQQTLQLTVDGTNWYSMEELKRRLK